MTNLRKIILTELNTITELIKPNDVNLSSFLNKNQLNPEIWENEKKIKLSVKKKLLKIANDFIDFLDLPWIEIKDITITGSLANYNWSKFSDIDLHILIDYNDINENEELVEDYLHSKRKLWNNTHNIKIHGFEVEVYAQNINEEHYSTGIYSLDDNKWLVKPDKTPPKLDKKLIKIKTSKLINKIDEIIELYYSEEYGDVLIEYEKIWDKIKKLRKSGLEREGEFSYENIVFKVLRRSGYIDKLIEIKNKSYDILNSM